MNFYNDEVIKHFTNPHNVGKMQNPDAIGEVGNPRCGDIMRMYLKIENGIIVDAKFKTFGCAAAIATSSVATDLIKGKKIEDALKITNNDVLKVLGGLPDIKIHCSVLAQSAIRAAISNYYSNLGIDPKPIVGTTS